MTNLTPIFIYRKDIRRIDFPYTVTSGKEWPWGPVAGIAMTLRGARRIARKAAARHSGDMILIERCDA